jgi:YggT family protein
MVQMLVRAVRDLTPVNDLTSKMDEVRGAARRAIARAVRSVKERTESAARDSACCLTPASISLSRAYSPLRHGRFAAMIPGDSAVEQVITSGLFSTLNIYNTLLIGRLILTWFPNPPRQIVYPLATLCDPYLNLFRGIIPPIGGTIDLSPILAFTVLNVFTNTAAALPCELNEDGGLKDPAFNEGPGVERSRGFAARRRERVARKLADAKKN